MRRMRVAAVCAAAVVTAVGGVAPAAGAPGGPEAELAYHGSADMIGGRVGVRFTPHNHGLVAVPESTVRIRWSEPLAERQSLPAGCAPAGERAVTCRVGALEADGVGERLGLRVRLRDAPSEVLLEFDTVGNDGAVAERRRSERQRVLVLDSGDKYYF
ncbi:hypothetical protein [Streptomyces sp. NPDC098781]|uniref:hypothetical protein n=1 Tax=Streptomyces sp. NPDC098781 TaxID=3366097 RepID=UPI00381242DC